MDQALDRVKSYGLSHVEIGAGAFMGKTHCDPAVLLQNEEKLAAFQEQFARRALTISTLSCYGNPLHPDPETGEAHAKDLKDCVRLSAKLGLGMVNCFAGMPANSEKADSATCSNTARSMKMRIIATPIQKRSSVTQRCPPVPTLRFTA